MDQDLRKTLAATMSGGGSKVMARSCRRREALLDRSQCRTRTKNKEGSLSAEMLGFPFLYKFCRRRHWYSQRRHSAYNVMRIIFSEMPIFAWFHRSHARTVLGEERLPDNIYIFSLPLDETVRTTSYILWTIVSLIVLKCDCYKSQRNTGNIR